jgi:site-specific DNA recombinase
MRAAIYTRISLDDAEGEERGKGVARQEKDARAELEKRGWQLVDVYTDNDVSATRTKVRPHYQRLLRDIRAGLVEAVIVWDIDRLTRTPLEIEEFITLADGTGLTLVNLTGAGDVGTDDGRMMLRIKGALARREVEQMRKRLRRKFEENAEDGKPHGRAPYGTKRLQERDSRGKLVNFWDVRDDRPIDGHPDLTAPQILQEIASRVLESQSLRSIAADLTKRGIPGPGSPTWNSTVIRQVLVRPSYAGIRIHRGRPIGQLQGEEKDRIFTLDVHDKLVALLTDPSRKQNHRGREPRYLLSGIAICGRCEGTMRSQIGHVVKKTGKRQPPSYGCSKCFRVRRQRQPVDVLVEAVVLKALADPRFLEKLYMPTDPKDVSEAMERIDLAKAKLDRNIDERDEGAITEDQFRRSNARWRAALAKAESDLRAAATTDQFAKFTSGDAVSIWKEATILERRELIEARFVVVIEPQGRGVGFDPSLVQVYDRDEWDASNVNARP